MPRASCKERSTFAPSAKAFTRWVRLFGSQGRPLAFGSTKASASPGREAGEPQRLGDERRRLGDELRQRRGIPDQVGSVGVVKVRDAGGAVRVT